MSSTQRVHHGRNFPSLAEICFDFHPANYWTGIIRVPFIKSYFLHSLDEFRHLGHDLANFEMTCNELEYNTAYRGASGQYGSNHTLNILKCEHY